MSKSPSRAVKVIEVIVVLIVLVGLIAVLMPTLHEAKFAAVESLKQTRRLPYHYAADQAGISADGDAQAAEGLRVMPAHVKSYKAQVDLTPRISIGTVQAESIYEASFRAEIEAINPSAAKGPCHIQLPLPPQLISLSELNVIVNGEPNEDVSVRDGVLVWRGRLDEIETTPISITYAAVGKGIYTLHTPPGKIIDLFEAKLKANKTNLKMLELSLQPQEPVTEAGSTTYTWKYKRLMIGRPIAVDILGIAPMDKLGELGWLGPLSVLIFGILVALMVMGYRPEKLDKWMLLLIVGTFTGAYPLMYFAQEFMSLSMAICGAAALVVLIIAIRTVTLLGAKLGIMGIVLLAAAVFALTLWATIQPQLQGVLLTIMIIGTFVLAMILLPKAREALAASIPAPSAPPAPPTTPTP